MVTMRRSVIRFSHRLQVDLWASLMSSPGQFDLENSSNLKMMSRQREKKPSKNSGNQPSTSMTISKKNWLSIARRSASKCSKPNR